MGKPAKSLRWGVEQRLEFIEFRLFWQGGINRADLIDQFGVSVPQASADLSHYQALAPANIAYDGSGKRYVATDHFRPLFLRPDADRYLSQLRQTIDGTLEPESTWIAQAPAFETVPLPHRNVDPEILQAVVKAIRAQKSVEIRYQSLAAHRPKPTWRRISPHALVFDGQRWHARAFCHIERNFADFLLPRFLGTRNLGDVGMGPENDLVWNQAVTVVLKPHPQLNEDQQRVVAKDYGMKSNRLHIPMRSAMLYYFLRRMNLDFEEEKRPTQQQHVVLANPQEVRDSLQKAHIE
jgi:predicted DNA-binding transcriptional regulator YafY